MMYLGDKAVGINDSMKIDWDAVALGEEFVIPDIVLSDFVTQITDQAFYALPIPSLIGNEVINIGYQAFYTCQKLHTIKIPKVQTIGAKAFQGAAITSLIAPNLKSTNSDFLYAAHSLQYLDIGNKTIESFIGNGYIFDHYSRCITILRYNFVLPAQSGWFYQGCWLKNTSVPGVLYVWKDLIDGYKNHEIWGPLLASNNNQILPIEGSIYETQYGDGTPMT